MAAINRAFGAIFVRPFTLFFLLFAGILGLYAQDSTPVGNVFSPFVSQLSIETRNNLVRLSWVDSADVTGQVYIFRSAFPFSEEDLSALHPEVVAYGAQDFVDDIETGTMYYFVAASDEQGQIYDRLIPYTNTIVLNLSGGIATTSGSFAQPNGSSAATSTGFAAAPQSWSGNESYSTAQTMVAGITATPEADKVIIQFSINGGIKSTILFRSTQPIRRVHDLINATNLASDISSPYVDYPTPGFTYYYALVFRDDISYGTETIQPGRNATIHPAEISGASAITGLRSMPLPALNTYRTSPERDYYSELPAPTPMRPETARNLESRPRVQATPPPAKRPRVFAVDLEASASGEDSALRAIVQGSFARREWENAREELFSYLARTSNTTIEARARFYLGQTYYFTGNGRQALVEFLFVQSRYPAEANEWIEAVLTGFAN